MTDIVMRLRKGACCEGAECERAKAQRDSACAQASMRKDAAAEIERLRAALERYGMHEPECPENDEPWRKLGCNCGFKTALEYQQEGDGK